jgi:ketosteroid isomerase-like protein
VLEGVFMRLGTEWDGFAAAADEFVDGGNTIVALGKYSGTYKATGKSFQANFAHVWKIQDGKATSFVQHVDTLVVHRALQA